MFLTDVHMHLSLIKDSQMSVQLAKKHNIRLITHSINLQDSLDNIALGYNNDNVKVCIGLHPWHIQEDFENDHNLSIGNNLDNIFDNYNTLLTHHCVIGIGEVGIDKKSSFTKDMQEDIVYKFLSFKKPMCFHASNINYLQKFCKKYNINYINGFIHGFNGSYQEARYLIDKGFKLSLGVNYLKSSKLKQVISKLGANYILIETDCDNKYECYDPSLLSTIYAHLCVNLRIDETKLWEILDHNLQEIFNHK